MCSVVPFFEILHAHQNHTAVCGGGGMVSSMIFEIRKFDWHETHLKILQRLSSQLSQKIRFSIAFLKCGNGYFYISR